MAGNPKRGNWRNKPVRKTKSKYGTKQPRQKNGCFTNESCLILRLSYHFETPGLEYVLGRSMTDCRGGFVRIRAKAKRAGLRRRNLSLTFVRNGTNLIMPA